VKIRRTRWSFQLVAKGRGFAGGTVRGPARAGPLRTWRSRTAPKRQLDARVPPTPLYKRVVPGQPGGFCFWDLRRRAILDPRVTVVLSFGCCFSHSWSGCISSQLAPVHSPLTSSTVDFVCSSYQAHFHLYFLRWAVSHVSLSTDARFFLFPAILVAQVLVGAMGNTPLIWFMGLGTFSVVILSCWILYICVWVPGFCTSTQGLHSFIASLSGLVSSRLSRRPSFCEGRVIGLM
jgi:hypothetical protein